MTQDQHGSVAPSWTDALLRDNRNERRPIKGNLANVAICLQKCPMLEGIIAFDEFARRVTCARPTPWRNDLGPWQSADDLKLTEQLLQHLGLNVALETTIQGVALQAHNQRYHPVRDHLRGLKWDGQPRMSTWLSSCLADDVAVMYAGQIVETGSIDGVLDAPRHPYTKGLLSSVPSRNARGVPLRQIPGAAPAANRFPAGCVFRPRCARAGAYCIEEPELIEASEGQLVRCFNPEETVGRERPSSH